MRDAPLVLDAAMTADQGIRLMLRSGVAGAPVREAGGSYRGTVAIETLRATDATDPVVAATDGTAPAVPLDSTLEAVVEVFATDHVSWVPVLDADRAIVGIVGTADLVAAYRRALRASLQSLRSIVPGSVLVERRVDGTSAMNGRTVGDAPWPPGAVLVAVDRGGQLIFPEPTTVLRERDELSLLVPAGTEASVGEAIDGADGAPEADDVPMV